MLGIGLHQPLSLMAIVELVGAAIPIPAFAKYEDIVAATEGIGEHSAGADIDIRIFSRSLPTGGAIEVPF